MILPRFKSPHSVLNAYFLKLLNGIRDRCLYDTGKDHDLYLVENLTQIAIALKNAGKTHHLESIEMKKRLAIVEKMLEECMQSESMDVEDNVTLVLQVSEKHDPDSLSYESLSMRRVQTFLSGALELCIRHNIHSLIGTAQVNPILSIGCLCRGSINV